MMALNMFMWGVTAGAIAVYIMFAIMAIRDEGH